MPAYPCVPVRDTLLDCVTHHRDIVEAGGSKSWNLHFHASYRSMFWDCSVSPRCSSVARGALPPLEIKNIAREPKTHTYG
jgi:hypothetical protein